MKHFCCKHRKQATFVCIQCCTSEPTLPIFDKPARDQKDQFFKSLQSSIDNKNLMNDFLLCEECLGDSIHSEHTFRKLDTVMNKAREEWIGITADFMENQVSFRKIKEYVDRKIDKFEFQNAFKNIVCEHFQTKIWVGEESDKILLLNLEKYRNDFK